MFVCISVVWGAAQLTKQNVTNQAVDFTKQNNNSIHQYTINDINGNAYNLNQLKGSVVLLVNTASKCGFTKQYKGLEALYNEFKDQSFVVIGIPSNNFGNQEPGSNETIKEFCSINFDVTFPMMAKMDVNGKNISPLFKFLTDKTIHPKTGGKVTWNFNKFLIDQNGTVIKRYSSLKKPLSNDIKNDILKLLNTTIN